MNQTAEQTEEAVGFVVSWTGPEGREEGPLSVLWDLIESYRVDIFDVSLLKITQDFLVYMKAAALTLEAASSFAVMAARLLFYKSRALLPDPGFEEEAEDRLPPELIQQLLEYRKFQFASEKLRDLEEITSGMMRRKIIDEAGEEWFEASLADLVQAFSMVLQRLKEEHPELPLYEVHLNEVSVEEKVNHVRALLKDAVSCLFTDILVDAAAKGPGEIIASFLAILELTKLGEILLRQKSNFGPIEIYRKAFTLS